MTIMFTVLMLALLMNLSPVYYLSHYMNKSVSPLVPVPSVPFVIAYFWLRVTSWIHCNC